jgi:hypothetical protein
MDPVIPLSHSILFFWHVLFLSYFSFPANLTFQELWALRANIPWWEPKLSSSGDKIPGANQIHMTRHDIMNKWTSACPSILPTIQIFAPCLSPSPIIPEAIASKLIIAFSGVGHTRINAFSVFWLCRLSLVSWDLRSQVLWSKTPGRVQDSAVSCIAKHRPGIHFLLCPSLPEYISRVK